MDRTFKLAAEKQFRYMAAVVAIPIVVVLILSSHRDKLNASVFAHPWLTGFIVFLFLMSGVILVLETFFVRIVATTDGVTIFDLLNRPKFYLAYTEIIAYRRKEDKVWRLCSAVREYRLPEINFNDFHSVIVLNAPRALNAKRWKCGQMPPNENFRSLTMLDGAGWFSHVIAIAIVGFPIIWIFGMVGIGLLAAPLFQAAYELKDLFGALSLDSTGITATWPWATKTIEWTDVKAVFCERNAGRRYFVVTSLERSIAIPRPIARDLEAMRKFFYSLPEGTLCVNFDKNFRRGYRVRRKRRHALRTAMPELLSDPF